MVRAYLSGAFALHLADRQLNERLLGVKIIAATSQFCLGYDCLDFHILKMQENRVLDPGILQFT
ncbi:hypothetical protein J6590_018923 [Homalodisca vitripennis]|nr:hypothetical protein J6590_018923 [Homalodisca vitripennis]